MKLSISNIAWGTEQDEEMYQFLQQSGFEGLEIAPTRIFPERPYEHVSEAAAWARSLKNEYGLCISSMQSIWFGHTEKIFGSKEERYILKNYTKQAILFAEAIGCHNLVFGNPKNRDTDNVAENMPVAIDFFKEIGDYAKEHNTCVALEPNPTLYNTRFMNTTDQAVEMVYKSCSEGIKVNVDLGTILYNNEDLDYLTGIKEYINHIHISEPGLILIERRPELHRQVIKLGQELDQVFVSVEMAKQPIDKVKAILQYIKSLADDVA